jgi:O-antigen/teichoic acid export membrane protein
LFGDAYRSAAPLVAYFLVAGALQAVRNVLGGMFKAFARGGSLAWIETVNSVLMLLVIVGLARREGALAGALAHLISAAVSISLALYLAARNLGLSPVRMISPAAAFKEGHALWRRTVLRRSA